MRRWGAGCPRSARRLSVTIFSRGKLLSCPGLQLYHGPTPMVLRTVVAPGRGPVLCGESLQTLCFCVGACSAVFSRASHLRKTFSTPGTALSITGPVSFTPDKRITDRQADRQAGRLLPGHIPLRLRTAAIRDTRHAVDTADISSPFLHSNGVPHVDTRDVRSSRSPGHSTSYQHQAPCRHSTPLPTQRCRATCHRNVSYAATANGTKP